jgi:superfamily II DNA or RNA helicase
VRDKIYLTKVNEVYLKINAEPSVIQELSDQFTFTVPGAKFMPAVRNRFWDGKIRLVNGLTGLTYAGLVRNIEEFANVRNYDFSVEDKLAPAHKLNDKYIQEFLDFCKLTKTPRDYQLNAFRSAVEQDRGVFLSPTASGKSLIIYLLSQFYNCDDKKVLVIVPRTSLVMQMKTDFESYTQRKLKIHCITAGVDKESTESIVITTWQSIYKMPKVWFKQFGCVIGDEAHEFKATSLKSIMEKLEDCRFRFGFTGTLDGSQTNKVTLEGLFGPVHQVTTTTELMEDKHVADLRIKAIILQYSSEIRQQCRGLNYQDEVDFLVKYEPRNKFLRNLALSLNGNTLVLFTYVDKHGKLLYDMMKAKEPERPIYFIHGGVDATDREDVRKIVEEQTNAIIVASYGTFSTGVNIRNLHNVVFSSPTKSRVRVLQSIGRGLRTSENKESMTLFDIADDLKHKTKVNFTLQHFSERLNIYNSEGFNYKIFNTSI